MIAFLRTLSMGFQQGLLGTSQKVSEDENIVKLMQIKKVSFLKKVKYTAIRKYKFKNKIVLTFNQSNAVKKYQSKNLKNPSNSVIQFF